jgi:high affinity Mn2+ porin
LFPLLVFFVLSSNPLWADELWSLHYQETAVPQFHPAFHSDIADGPLSLTSSPDLRVSFTTTLFLGRRLWEGGEFYFNPELSAGSGLSDTHGVAGYPNGEVYRVDTPSLKFNLSRLYLKQSFGLGNEAWEAVDPDKNQLGGHRLISSVTVMAGKLSLNDFLDDNSYSHDPRTQFLNWALMDNGAWDYAADTRGYTWMLALVLNQPRWTLRLASGLVPLDANGLEFDLNIAHARGDNAEFEYRYPIADRSGKARLLAYVNSAHMGDYAQAVALAARTPDIKVTRDYRTKVGLGLNVEQELTASLGAFLRLGWNDGKTETWAFTEIDRTISLGLSLKGELWGRAGDTLGGAGILNGLSKEHADYLTAGGVGFIVGDGSLSYAPELIAEIYYQYKPIDFVGLTADFQFVSNPGYDSSRGPVSIGALRGHFEF